jgi:hypothetical protein
MCSQKSERFFPDMQSHKLSENLIKKRKGTHIVALVATILKKGNAAELF